jgi:fructose-specific phosphotransferase system IIC component
MLTPWILRVGFIVGILTFIGVGIYDMIALREILLGIMVIILGPIFLRLVLELFMVYFTVNETLTDIRNLLRQKASHDLNQPVIKP